jgi:hypothetical protein
MACINYLFMSIKASKKLKKIVNLNIKSLVKIVEE